MDITYSLNLYDSDGDIYNNGIFLHFGDTLMIKCKSTEELRNMIKKLSKLEKEISTYDLDYYGLK